MKARMLLKQHPAIFCFETVVSQNKFVGFGELGSSWEKEKFSGIKAAKTVVLGRLLSNFVDFFLFFCYTKNKIM